MSLVRKDDYYKESKKNKVVSHRRGSHGGVAVASKVTLPTQHRTPKHKCSQCQRTDAKKYSIGPKDARWLCVVCVAKHNNKSSIEKPNFVCASKLKHKSIVGGKK